ncbi:hypothetical protein ES703_89931 [subsurface metagenome]
MPKISKEIKEEKKEALLRSLEGGVSITDACEAANVSRNTIWEWRKKSKRFDNKINSIIDSRTQSMEDALYASGIKGNVAAQIFWLKNRAKDRWSDRTTHEVALELTFANLMKMKKKQEKGTKTNRIPFRRGG